MYIFLEPESLAYQKNLKATNHCNVDLANDCCKLCRKELQAMSFLTCEK